MGQAGSTRCPACAASDLEVFFEMPAVPASCNVLFATREEAAAASRGDIRLGFCRTCAMIYNVAFDPAALSYGVEYENSLHYSPRFQGYAERLAERLISTYGLDGRVVLEIGCGKGDFLALLAAGGRNRCVGFDASYDGRQTNPYLQIVRSPWDPELAKALRADFVVCRHVLEHLEAPAALLASIVHVLGDRAAVYFEVPDAIYTLADLGIWDVIYEHCSYFTAPALARLFAEQGLPPAAIGREFDGQFLAIEYDGRSRSACQPELGVAEVAARVEQFAGEFARKAAHWSASVADSLDRGRRIAVWGAGSKGVTFLNTVARGAEIHAVVDINQRKVGRFVAGTGQRIVSPAQLRDDPVDLVLVMNPNYRAEIEAQLAELRVAAEVAVV